MDYIEVTIDCPEDLRDILTAELAEVGFESFMETDQGIQAYVPILNFEPTTLNDIKENYADSDLSFVVKVIAHQNWNEEWEKNYDPIRVGDQILVRASFHDPDPEVKYQIEINPKTSFGTGHHATTHLMLQQMLNLKVEGRRVYDVGTGTGILAIMACLLKAAHVEANDVEQWTVENCRENCQLNGCDRVQVYYGALSLLSPAKHYDVMLANINRNVLLEEMPLYYDLLNADGDLLLSGFYEKDVDRLLEEAHKLGLESKGYEVRNEWACLHLHKGKK